MTAPERGGTHPAVPGEADGTAAVGMTDAGTRGGAAFHHPRRSGTRWTVLTVVELALAVAAVLLDLLLPSLVILVIAALSLIVRHESLGTLGHDQPARTARTAQPARQLAAVVGLAMGWTLVDVAVVMPVVEHVTGQDRDLSRFAPVEGDLVTLVTLLLLAWAVGAVGEELAFRGFVLTRCTDLLGSGTAARAVAVLVSAVLFGLTQSEFGVAAVAVAVVDGIFYGVLRYRFGTLWAPIVAHGTVNTVGLLVFFVAGPLPALW